MKRAFTLIELMVAFGVSCMLLGVFYFYFFGLGGTHLKAQQKDFLNKFATNALERIVRELRMATEFVEVGPDLVKFRRYHVSLGSEEEAQEYTGEKPEIETVTFRRREIEKAVVWEKQIGLGKFETQFTVDSMEPEVFTFYALDRTDPEKDRFPMMHAFDFSQHIGSDLDRIVLVTIRFDMKLQRDALQVQTRVSLPALFSHIMQPAWNAE